jgi:curved DNA-binding protein
VKTGSKVRVRGQGAKTAQGEVGDLYLTVKVMDMTPYERKDDDLYRDVDVNVFTAMIGGEIKVETLAGEMAVKVPAGTSSGKLVRLRGKGMPKLAAKDEHGDLYLRVNIHVPKHITEEDRWTLEKIAKRYADK